MARPVALVVTSVSAPNPILRSLADGCLSSNTRFLLIGDSKSPANFELPGCEFYSLKEQRHSGFRYAQLCPERSYARKNIGYLLAMRGGAQIITETDDDNHPRDAFWTARHRSVRAPSIEKCGWVNVYAYFTDAKIWPRGLPLTEVQSIARHFEDLPVRELDCPIQQGLADENPDVDAVYRLLLPLPQNFRADRRLILSAGAWCPINSQNTTWFADSFPLLYLPACCNFRMTDIWRGFVAQRIAWTNGWSILFHEPTVSQERNEHNVMRDFEDEIPGYLMNPMIAGTLNSLDLAPGPGNIAANLLKCYRALIGLGAIGAGELDLIDAWLDDFSSLPARVHQTAR